MTKKALCSVLLVFTLIFGMSAAYASSFYDVDDDFWASPYIENLTSRGIISGYGDGTFLPNDYVQRSEYAKMLVNSAGIPLSGVRTSPYADVSANEWYFPYINSVTRYLNGYQSSTPGDERIYFKPLDYATREDVTVALMKAMGYTYEQLLQKYTDTQYLLSDVFYDYESIARQDRPFIAEAVNLGYITGTQSGTFQPADPITRCEVCAVLWRAFPEENIGFVDFTDDYDNTTNINANIIGNNNFENVNTISEVPSEQTLGISDLYLNVFYLNVGQGDSEFIELPGGQTMLIDASTYEYGQVITDFIKSRGHERIDYLIATHPHADHIGGMTTILDNFDVGDIFMPNALTNTKTYENLLTKILEKEIPVTEAKAGLNILYNNILSVSMLAPSSEIYSDLNNYSAVVRIVYNDTSFLFMGDAEVKSENEILKSFSISDIRSNVIKIGHHGSSTSTSSEFIQSVSPQYAVISCGINNEYGHPHEQTINRLLNLGIEVLRTDISGTIQFVSDGNTIYKQTDK